MVHQHPCTNCGWLFPCTCNDPAEHGDLCFECSAKPPSGAAGGISPPGEAQESPEPENVATDESWPGWERA